MSPPIHRDRTAVRFWLGLAALGCGFVGIAASNAQAPVITNPGDLRSLSVNTAFRPSDPNPAWTVMAPMPTARSGFATAAADGKVYAMGGAVLNTCVTVDTVEAYDPNGDFWITPAYTHTQAPSFPSGRCYARQHHLFGWRDGRRMIRAPTSFGHGPSIRSRDNRWSDKQSLPEPRLQVGLGEDSVNHLLYAVGGATAAPDYKCSTWWRSTTRLLIPGHPGRTSEYAARGPCGCRSERQDLCDRWER